jgi:maltooligosyltrehalose trehalohydrolase
MRVKSGTLNTESGEEGRTYPPAPAEFLRSVPVGAEAVIGGGTHFRVWAPKAREVRVQLAATDDLQGRKARVFALDEESAGYFSGYDPEAEPGMIYRYQLSDGAFPDPASRFQPQGPHGPSQIIDPRQFRWTDEGWRGVSRAGQVLYEMHVGTFTHEGTWAAAAKELPELAGLGITVIELMPVADFAGSFGWGYDGVDLFAPTRLYGTPDEFRAFVDRAHSVGVGVLLDVVYNHLGPDGNYLRSFSDSYFTDRYENEWGDAINYDGPGSGPVREFFSSNAAYWIREYHLDGLRLDATQQMFDSSPEHIEAVIVRRVREAAGNRATIVVGENEPQEVKLLEPAERGGHGFDALWNDDFHHSALAALTGHNEAYYSDYRGLPQEFISLVKWGYLYQGQWFSWQHKRRGSPTFGQPPEAFINYLQNHDQVANSLHGYRVHHVAAPGQLRALTALLLLGPSTPMLFQGQEFAASAPFLYFACHEPELAHRVAHGRKNFLCQFPSIACRDSEPFLNDPGSLETFIRSKLDFSDRERHRPIYGLHRDLLQLRREDPVFSRPRKGGVDGAVLGPEAFVLRFFGLNGDDRLLIINLGQDLSMNSIAEPLLAPVANGSWSILWCSEAAIYGGNGTPMIEGEGNWRLPGRAAVVFK